MPVIKSAIKGARQTSKHKAYNVGVKTEVKAKFNVVRDSVATGKIKDNTQLVAAIREIDKAVKRGVIKKQTADRKKSRLTKAYNSVAAKPFGTESAGQRTGKPKAAAKKSAAKKPASTKKK
jgi:small subunit ribosomal protein S20